MATLSATQQAKICYYMGYSQSGSLGTNSILLAQHLASASFTVDFVSIAQSLLDSLAEIEAAFSRITATAGVLDADIARLDAGKGLAVLNAQATQAVSRLASHISYPVLSSSPYYRSGAASRYDRAY